MRTKKRSFPSFPSLSREQIAGGLVTLLVVGMALVLLVSSYRLYQERSLLQERSDQLAEQVQELEEQTELLEQGLEESQTDFYLEKTARDTLGMKKEGEKVIAVLFPEEKEEEEEQGLFEGLLERLGF